MAELRKFKGRGFTNHPAKNRCNRARHDAKKALKLFIIKRKSISSVGRHGYTTLMNGVMKEHTWRTFSESNQKEEDIIKKPEEEANQIMAQYERKEASSKYIGLRHHYKKRQVD